MTISYDYIAYLDSTTSRNYSQYFLSYDYRGVSNNWIMFIIECYTSMLHHWRIGKLIQGYNFAHIFAFSILSSAPQKSRSIPALCHHSYWTATNLLSVSPLPQYLQTFATFFTFSAQYGHICNYLYIP